MRPDINKVLCERQRGGSRDYMGSHKGYEKEYRFNGEDRTEFGDLDSLPSFESMTRRLGYDKRSFGENLGALKGWVRSMENKPWDKAYSELCRLCPPSGTNIQRHAHQHLDGYIERNTVILDNGKVGFNNKWSARGLRPLYQPIGESRCDFYVHPKTKCVCRVRTQKISRKKWRDTLNQEMARCFRMPSKTEVIAKLKGIWYHFDLEAPNKVTNRFPSSVGDYFTSHTFETNPDQLKAEFSKEHGQRRGVDYPYTLNARAKRQLSARELRVYQISNDQKAA